LEESVALIDAITVRDVRDFAEQMANRAPMAMALYGPVDAAPTRTTLEERRVA
ncbi:MAG: insulinase family protein, partial [Tateyamaria sp.]